MTTREAKNCQPPTQPAEEGDQKKDPLLTTWLHYIFTLWATAIFPEVMTSHGFLSSSTNLCSTRLPRGGVDDRSMTQIPTLHELTSPIIMCKHLSTRGFSKQKLAETGHNPNSANALEMGWWKAAPYLASFLCSKDDLLRLTNTDRENKTFLIAHIGNGVSIRWQLWIDKGLMSLLLWAAALTHLEHIYVSNITFYCQLQV